jgi:adenosylcobinamide-GDP ribazoletransferase
MLLAPAVGLLIAGGAALAYLVGELLWGAGLAPAVLSVATMAILTRGLHLDGLADTADGLGSGRTGADGVAVMRRSDIGPFGVVTVTLTLLAQVALLSIAGGIALLIAVPTGRLAATIGCTVGVPAAADDGLGRAVAGTVPRSAAGLLGAAVVVVAVVIAGPLAAAAVAGGVLTAGWLLRRGVRRFGGITGDLLGAAVEVATTIALAVLAVGVGAAGI